MSVVCAKLVTFSLFTMTLMLAPDVRASFEEEKEQIQKEIKSLLINRGGLNPDSQFEFDVSGNISDLEQIAQMRKLTSTLYKVKNFLILKKLNKITLAADAKKSTFNFPTHDEMTLTLSLKDKENPWILFFSSEPSREDSPQFIEDQMILRVQDLRFHPPEGDEKSIETSALPFKPYSSSYLPLWKGDVLLPPQPNRIDKLLKKEISLNYESQSAIERYDAIRQAKLGQSTKILTDEFRGRVHRPEAKFWEGHCNQWAAGALDREVNQFISSVGGLICDDILISEGELKELFTLFYSDYSTRLLAGERTRYDPSIHDRWLRSYLGLDDLAAQDFHNHLHRYLKREKGLVMEISSDVDVWNQPVFRAKSSGILSSDSLLSLQRIGPLIPADLLESRELKDRGILQEYQSIEKELIDWAKGEVIASSDQESWNAQWKKFSKTVLHRPVPELMLRRAEIFTHFILPSIASGRVSLSKGVRAEYISTEVDYGTETPYAAEGFKFSTRSYSYLLFKKGDQIIDGRWVDSPEDRPDFLWFPQNRREPSIGRKQVAPEVENLFQLAHHCKKAADVFSFFAYVRKTLSDSVISPEEAREIRDRMGQVENLVDMKEFKSLFTEKRIRGAEIWDQKNTPSE